MEFLILGILGIILDSAQEIQGSEDFLYCHGFLIIVTHDILY